MIDDQFKQAVYDDIDINSGFKLVEINRNAIASDATDDGFKLEDFTRNAAYEGSLNLKSMIALPIIARVYFATVLGYIDIMTSKILNIVEPPNQYYMGYRRSNLLNCIAKLF